MGSVRTIGVVLAVIAMVWLFKWAAHSEANYTSFIAGVLILCLVLGIGTLAGIRITLVLRACMGIIALVMASGVIYEYFLWDSAAGMESRLTHYALLVILSALNLLLWGVYAAAALIVRTLREHRPRTRFRP